MNCSKRGHSSRAAASSRLRAERLACASHCTPLLSRSSPSSVVRACFARTVRHEHRRLAAMPTKARQRGWSDAASKHDHQGSDAMRCGHASDPMRSGVATRPPRSSGLKITRLELSPCDNLPRRTRPQLHTSARRAVHHGSCTAGRAVRAQLKRRRQKPQTVLGACLVWKL